VLDVLARANADVLRQFAASNVLLAFDFDGTLAPIVAEPKAAAMRPRTAELMRRLCRRYPCAAISGRAVADLRPRLEGLAFVDVVGNHGLEPGRRGAEFASVVAGWWPVLERSLAPLRGVVLENKRFSVAVHYRESREKRAAKAAIAEVARELEPLRIIGGKHVVNLLPPGGPHKGLALTEARVRHGCDTALYVGDDETDEDVFALEHAGLLTIRVGCRASSRAAFYLRRQRAIDELIERLLALRPAPVRQEGKTHARRPTRAAAAAAAG